MNKDFSPRHLDVVQFGKSQGQMRGHTPLAQLSRLLQDLEVVPRDADEPYGIEWEASGWVVEGTGGQADQSWMRLVAKALVPQICQRCTGLVNFPIELDYQYRFVATEKEAMEQDEWAQEDVLVLSKAFDLVQLIEDELLMAMPIIPRHERCDVSLPMQVADAAFQGDEPVPHPFDALKAIKNLQ